MTASWPAVRSAAFAIAAHRFPWVISAVLEATGEAASICDLGLGADGDTRLQYAGIWPAQRQPTHDDGPAQTRTLSASEQTTLGHQIAVALKDPGSAQFQWPSVVLRPRGRHHGLLRFRERKISSGGNFTEFYAQLIPDHLWAVHQSRSEVNCLRQQRHRHESDGGRLCQVRLWRHLRPIKLGR